MQSSLTSSMNQPAIEIFFSYARKDELLRDELNKHLKPLQQEGIITAWHDREIPPGAEWQNEIDRHLESAQIILLLISADFLASDYCYGFELKRALERHESKAACVIPVILRSCDWQRTDFGKLAALPTDGKAINSWLDRDEAFTDVAIGLRQNISQLQRAINCEAATALTSLKFSGANSTTQPSQNKYKFKNQLEPALDYFSFKTVRIELNKQSSQIIDSPKINVRHFMEDIGDGLRLSMIEIPSGDFLMGSAAANSTKPIHSVLVPRFYMGQALITQMQWQSLMGGNPSHFKGDGKLPVENVSWLDSMEFCRKLSQKTGRIYRLPSEAEWEYACRSGSTENFAFGSALNLRLSNYKSSYSYLGRTTLAGSSPANAFGLYDMHGNLWEWCLDEWVDNYNDAPIDGSARGDANLLDGGDGDKEHVIRGGSFISSATHCRSAFRTYASASYRGHSLGFRVVAVSVNTFSR
jgi:formylglycine-generating enzyme required for sulfatase activity